MKGKYTVTVFFVFLQYIHADLRAQDVGQIKIGEQIWTTTNLNVSRFQNGDAIYEAKTTEQWVKANKEKKPAWCYYKNNTQNGASYGKLYNWHAINDPRGLAPKGWHIPSKSEWEELFEFLRNKFDAVSGPLKTKVGWKQYQTGGYETGSDCAYCDGTGLHRTGRACWICGGTGGDRKFIPQKILSGNGTNKVGFSAKPGSNRFDDGDFNDAIGEVAGWWSATESTSDNAYFFSINSANKIEHREIGKGYGLSVRLIRGLTPQR